MLMKCIMKQREYKLSKHLFLRIFLLWVFSMAHLSCSSRYPPRVYLVDSISEIDLGSIVAGNDTLKLSKTVSYTNQNISTRCTARLWITLNGVTNGSYYLGGDDYDFYLKDDTLVCIARDSGYKTKIDLSKGIPPSIFIISSCDDDSAPQGDFYIFQK